MDIKSKTCVLTGSTSGIGRETAMQLAKRGVNLVLPVRDLKKGNLLRDEIIKNTGNERVHIMECDLASFQSIRNFASSFLEKNHKLHILINNAGLWEYKHNKSKDGIEMTFAVNHLAPFLLTNLLLDVMRKSAPARIITVSSVAHRFVNINFDDPEGNKSWNNFRAYSQSKLANILFTRKLAEKLEKDRITVNCLHPGIIATRLFNKLPVIKRLAPYFLGTAEKGARTTLYLATSSTGANVTGQYFSGKKIRKVSKVAKNDMMADKLWELSLEMTGMEKEIHEKQLA